MLINEQRLVETFMDMVRIDSVSLHEAKMAQYLTDLFTGLGYVVVEDVQSKQQIDGATTGNIIVTIPGDLGATPIILSTHMDTVAPGIGIEPVLEAGTIRSAGNTILGGDDKGGIAQVVEAIRTIHECDLPHPPIQLLFSVAEEIGLLGSKHVTLDLLQGQHLYVIDGGPEVGDATIGGASSYVMSGVVRGQQAHAATHPERGISAIQVLADAISQMNMLKISDETSMNIGKVICDSPLNIVPDEARFELEVRSLNDVEAQTELTSITNILEATAKKYGAVAQYEIVMRIKAFQIPIDAAIVQHFAHVNERLGIPTRTKRSRGGTDLSILHERLGIEGMVLTVGSKDEHSIEESVDVAKLVACTERLVHLITAYVSE